MAVILTNNAQSGHMSNQLTRSLERILEDANTSGELKLSGRKLKDFPKAAGKYNLCDTVIADLSRNRFCELPEEVTTFAFLETLFAYHNAIKTIPETIKCLHSLCYLDLRNNQLSSLPREICFLPVQVLLVSNNRLASLPEELGRMEHLTELDVACNQITHLPTRIGDLVSLRSFSLRNNLLMYIPRELTLLQLVSLDVSCNKIAALPVELRLMTTLVDLELSNNPLTSPPASLSVRGLVHIFKYLENMVSREEKTHKGYDSSTLRRQTHPKNLDRRQNIDSGYLTSDCGSSMPPPPLNHQNVQQITGNSEQNHYGDDCKTPSPVSSSTTGPEKSRSEKSSPIDSNDGSPETYSDGGDRNKLECIQTYREYKEALRQQRNHEHSAIYRTASQSPDTPDSYPKPMSPNLNSNHHTIPKSNSQQQQQHPHQQRQPPHHTHNLNNNRNSNPQSPSSNRTSFDDSVFKKPIQKVIPSRNVVNGNVQVNNDGGRTSEKCVSPSSSTASSEGYAYIKPHSPLKASGILAHNNVPMMAGGGTSPKNVNQSKAINRAQWNRNMDENKMSFTMRREIDKQKEELELIDQLKTIIESKLKMTLPDNIAPALMDGVVLCHLANHIRPRSVASIHVPSPTVPKLTMARCRKNVDNFLEACRKIGVDEELICSCDDIVQPVGIDDADTVEATAQNATLPMFVTVRALLIVHNSIRHSQQSSRRQPPNNDVHNYRNTEMMGNGTAAVDGGTNQNATNTKNTKDDCIKNANNNIGIVIGSKYSAMLSEIDTDTNHNCSNALMTTVGSDIDGTDETDHDNYYDEDEEYERRRREIAMTTANEQKRFRIAPKTLDLSSRNTVRRKLSDSLKFKSIIEECEYDSDVGKFNCPPSDQSSLSTPIDYNNLDIPKSPCIEHNDNLNILAQYSPKIIDKEIEFIVDGSHDKILNVCSVSVQSDDCCERNDMTKLLSSIVLMGIFLSTCLLLYLYPVSN